MMMKTPGRDATADPASREDNKENRHASLAPGNFLVVAIGASAGGLEACRNFLSVMPSRTGMAYIFVQHLEPNHPSMVVELLASHTTMAVRQAHEGMEIEPDTLYVIEPATELSVIGGALHTTHTPQRQGARLPFDALLQSLAHTFGHRGVAVVLSGYGSDGSAALKAIKSKLGLVIAQDPLEAASDGMPRSAIEAGVVDLVLPVASMPEAIRDYDIRRVKGTTTEGEPAEPTIESRLPEIIAVLRERTARDFKGYKPGTLQRRIERRMGLLGDGTTGVDDYIGVLRSDAAEAALLADDILINVTQFFRDPEVFAVMAETVIPQLVARRRGSEPLRIWVAGCSSGEEAYSLVMLLLEHADQIGGGIKLQVFASDADSDAIALAREAYYPDSIAADVSPERLERFFSKEKHGYRVLPELRAPIIFACQDLLTDPPFSRLDLISCRNVLIYLGPAAQTRVIDLFHFALRENGVLLLGNAEAIDAGDARFAAFGEIGKIYRHLTRCRPGEIRFAADADDNGRGQRITTQEKPRLRPMELAELCRRMVIEYFAPAAILINHRNECLYSIGPTERFLRISAGHPTHDLLDLAPQTMRTHLRSALIEAKETRKRARTKNGGDLGADETAEVAIDVIPVPNGAEQLLLVCFSEVAKREPHPTLISSEPRSEPDDIPRRKALEIEIEATRSELQHTVYDLEQAREERRAISEEASSVAEEYQSTNEELLTSKEELQSLNEELTALNVQLRETLERQKTTSDYLQNILYSTDVATLFLDSELRIRFFTPATRQLFNVIPSDVGRPLGDLSSLSADRAALDDARSVLATLVPIEREIQTQNGVWFLRRILPYRTNDDEVEGVVLTFTDVSERKRTAAALLDATKLAQAANVAKSRFLAVASHDLRQPLQSMVLIQGLLAKQVADERPRRLLARLDETLTSMSGMLNTFLDINQIEVGAIQPKMRQFRIDDLLRRLRDEFNYHASARGLALRVVPCSLSVTTDPRLLEQMLRNLLSNAVKYTETGKILIGCRRRHGVVSVEVWDTGIGIPKSEFESIFNEHYQIGNPARQRIHGLGLGLSIVQRLADLLQHRISVRSLTGKGSAFAIEIKAVPAQPTDLVERDSEPIVSVKPDVDVRTDLILVVEDDPEVRDLLEDFLLGEGYHVETASDGATAELLVARSAIQPDLVITDQNLPNGMTGLELVSRVRALLGVKLPVIVLSGDTTIEAVQDVPLESCVHLNKPVRTGEIATAIQRLLPRQQTGAASELADGPHEVPGIVEGAHVYVVDDDLHVREQIRELLLAEGLAVDDFSSAEDFLKAFRKGGSACLLIDAHLSGMSGIEALQKLRESGNQLPAIIITGHSDVDIAVKAMKSAALDFIVKPVSRNDLLAAIHRALELSRDQNKLSAWKAAATSRLADLTHRQRQIMGLVLAGHPSKNIAADLGISQRTVENHRAAIMHRTGAKSLPELARLAVAAAANASMQNYKDSVSQSSEDPSNC